MSVTYNPGGMAGVGVAAGVAVSAKVRVAVGVCEAGTALGVIAPEIPAFCERPDKGVDVSVAVGGTDVDVHVAVGDGVGLGGILVGGMSVGSTKGGCVGAAGVGDEAQPAAMPAAIKAMMTPNPMLLILLLQRCLGDLAP